MSILDWILPARRDAEVTQWATQLVERQHHYVWARLSERAGTLASLAEARGYIRSRARVEIRDGLRAMVSSLPLASELHDPVLRRAGPVGQPFRDCHGPTGASSRTGQPCRLSGTTPEWQDSPSRAGASGA